MSEEEVEGEEESDYEYEQDLENIEWEGEEDEEHKEDKEDKEDSDQISNIVKVNDKIRSKSRSSESDDQEDETFEFDFEEETDAVTRGKRTFEKISTKKSRIIKKLLRDDAYEVALIRCEEDLALIVSWLKDVVEWGCDDIVASILQSILPVDLLGEAKALTTPIAHLEKLARWTRATFRAVSNSDVTFEEGRDGSRVDGLVQVIKNRTGTSAQLCQLWLALLRSLKYRCRLVASIDPESLSPYDHSDLFTFVDSVSLSKINNRVAAKKTLDGKLLIWCEVWLSSEVNNSASPMSNSFRWVPVHPILNIFNAPENIESKIRKGKVVKYAVAIEPTERTNNNSSFALTDVTARYNYKHQQVTKIIAQSEQACRQWLDQELERMTSIDSLQAPQVELRKDGSILIDLVDDESDSVGNDKEFRTFEKAELQKSSIDNKTIAIPKSFTEFKDHPVYILERYLLHDEVIHPQKKVPVGIFKGEPIYLCANKEKLRTKIHWRKELRRVMNNEQPIKVTKKQVRRKNDDDGKAFESIEWNLFGIWQTQKYEIPHIVDGVIPTNEHGNIEVWGGNKLYVPKGATFVEHILAIKAAKALGINYAPALIGFDSRGSHSIPKIGGVVVLDAQVPLLRDALFEMEAFRDEEAYNKKEKEIMEKWARLSRRMLTRNRLRIEYGH